MTYVTDLLLTEMDSKKLTGVVLLDLKRPLIQCIMHYSLQNVGTMVYVVMSTVGLHPF